MGSLFYKILGIDKRFLAIEPSCTDIIYVSKMILIYSAAENQPEILEEAPDFFSKHLIYLKDEYVHYFQHKKQD